VRIAAANPLPVVAICGEADGMLDEGTAALQLLPMMLDLRLV
jgi:hypothetical protein